MGTFLYRHVEAVHKGRHDRYTDVNPDSAHATGVAWLADYQVIGGCETDKFCPDRPATRAEAAAIIHGVATRPAMWGPGNNSFTPQPAEPQPTEPSEASARFDDVATGVWYEQAVSWMIAHEVTAGCGPRMFCPDRVLTRQQFVTFLWRAAGQPTPEFSGSSAFSDVAEGAYSDQAISWAVSRGVTAGCTEGEPGDPDWRFCPTEPVTRGQMGTFMYRHVQAVHQGRQDRYSDVKPTSTHATGVAWLADFEVIGGCDTAMFCPDRPATRAEAAAIIHGVATRPAMWGPGTNPFTPQPTEPQPTEPSEAPSGSTVQRIGLVSRE